MSEEPVGHVVPSGEPVIARIPFDDERVAYYLYTAEGKAVFGPKHRAANLGKHLQTVLRQLQQMLPNEEFEVIGQHVRFKRKGKKETTDERDRFGQPHYGHDERQP